MKTLHLMRHAKSRRDLPKLDDHERPLSARGIEDTMAIAEHCARAGIEPGLVLCSSAVRTRATLALLIPYLAVPRIEIERGLYLAGVPSLFARVTALDDAIASVLLIGHNDGLHEFAIALAGAGDAALRRQLDAKFPTAALASIELDVSTWRRVAPQAGTLVGLVTPKELRC
jgi:phosphohistidine phosphatase